MYVYILILNEYKWFLYVGRIKESIEMVMSIFFLLIVSLKILIIILDV